MSTTAPDETPRERPEVGAWKALGRDRVFRLAVAVGVLALTPSFLPLLTPAGYERYAHYYSDIPLILLVVLAFRLRSPPLPSRAERRFWDVLSLGAVSWLSVKVLDLVVPLELAQHPHLQLVRAAGFAGLYLAFVTAIELQPHAADGPQASRPARLETRGAIALALGLFAYFAVIPTALAQRPSETTVPRLLVYLLLDLYLLVRLTMLLASRAPGRGWRLSYAGLLLAVLCWAGADAAETLARAALLSEDASGRILDILWLPPFLALVAAARLRHGPGAHEPAEASVVSRPQRRGPLILQAAALPLLHFVLVKTGALDPGSVGLREACAGLTGAVIGWLALAHQRAMEQENEALAAARLHAAEAASLTKSRFLATMSHELRTPLNGVLGATELLLRSRLDEGQRRLGEILRLSAQSLQDMVSDVLDFSRIEAGRLDLEIVDLEPRRVLEEVAALLRPQAESKGLGVTCRVEADVPERVRGDPTRLRQILVNLASNAVKFTDRGGVELHLMRGEGGGGRVGLCFEVRDTGIGIPPDAGARVFDAFSQADGSTTRRFGGSGLGLAISRELARLMGGELDYESAVGVGTTFRLTVGFAPALGPEQPQPSPGRPTPARPISVPGMCAPRAYVLVVDDNAVNLEVAQAMLRSLGCEAEVAADGAQALAALRRRRYDVVFMDCMMPGMDGYDTTKALRQLEASADVGERTPVVALTASATPEDRARCLAADMDDYLSKPFRRQALDTVLARWVGPAAPTPVPSRPVPTTPG